MKFKKALSMMTDDGYFMKRPTWGGYWAYDSINHTIMMHTKEGDVMDIRETIMPLYTLDCILSDDWEIANSENCTLLGGAPTFKFDDALRWLNAGQTLTRKSKRGILYTKNSVFSVSDIEATDWMFNDK